MFDTIVALATPTGRSGIGIIRLSGVDTLAITRKLVAEADFRPEPRKAILKKIYEPASGELLDESLITYFQSPNSFTGEDVIEISCHGSPILLRQVLDECLKLDARMAEAGEFTLRALSNGRMNLSQAEAIRDLIDAQTAASARQAVRQLRGELSNQLQPIKDELLNVIVVLESSLEFVEDDLPEMQTASIRQSLGSLSADLEKMAATFKAGRLLREGLKVTLAGRPNVGKSSLFNVLLGHDRAIVTEIAGTTRDSLHERITIKGIPVALTDTAGLRETSDTVESLGVERTKRVMADSDLVIVILDGSEELTDEDRQILDLSSDLTHIIAINKSDLPGARTFLSASSEARDNSEPQRRRDAESEVVTELLLTADGAPHSAIRDPQFPVLHISAKTEEGLTELEEAIIAPFAPQEMEQSGFLVSDTRHHDLLRRAKTEIDNSIKLLDEHRSEEIVLISLHNAIRLLGEITGETTTEDMLTRIFSTFCIGK
jgi:tRNA modification GTPase